MRAVILTSADFLEAAARKAGRFVVLHSVELAGSLALHVAASIALWTGLFQVPVVHGSAGTTLAISLQDVGSGRTHVREREKSSGQKGDASTEPGEQSTRGGQQSTGPEQDSGTSPDLGGGAHEGGSTEPAVDPRFFSPPPEYPAVARRRKIEGRVLLTVSVAKDGTVDNVVVEQSSGSSLLDLAARDAVRQWRFVPAQRHGTPIRASVAVPVVFRLNP